jgi:heme/copper-type cytochrome/quinol oxidase subunit 2
MRATVTVHETAEFEKWQADQGTPAAARIAPADTTGAQPTTSESEESA